MPYFERLNKLRQYLREQECNALIVEDSINLYYLTGIHLSAGSLLVEEKDAFLFVDSRYFELCKKSCSIEVILTNKNQTIQNFLKNKTPPLPKLAFSSDITSYQRYQELHNSLNSISTLIPLNNPVKFLRRIKDDDEIKKMQASAILGSQGFDFVCHLLKEGISEEDVALQLEIFWKQHGSKGLAFDPIIAFGANSSMPHHRSGQTRLKKGDTVLIDIGVNKQGYHSDMTRVVFFQGTHPEILTIYTIVKDAQQAALNLCHPGTSIEELDNAARNLITTQGYGEQFTHNLGHGVGLEIHEWPTLRNTPPENSTLLEEGMVITIEPGIYLPEIGGVRLEDTVVITKNGHLNLTRGLRPLDPCQRA